MAGLRILVLNGPNLNLLGQRQPDVYGHKTLDDIDKDLIEIGRDLGAQVESRQTNHEGELVEWIQGADVYDALLINPAAFTHTSVAIRDAIANLEIPCYEVHISNVYKREPFRRQSFCADVVVGRIMGFGTTGYELALRGAVTSLRTATDTTAPSGD